jgi:multiple sugar transport system substrate-binding protein
MRILKKLLVLSLVLAISVCGLFANGAPEATTNAAEKTELVWAVWDIANTPYYQPIVDAFQAANPGITVRMVDLGSADFMTSIQTQLASGTSEFDIVSIKDIPGYNNLINKNMIVNLSDYIAKDKVDTSLYGGMADQLSVDGKLYTLPFISSFWVVYYNKDLFDAAGVAYPTNDMTFQEYDALARKMTSGSGANKVYGCHYHTWRSCVQLFGILDGKHTIIEPPYDFLKPYYEMVLAEQNDGICQNLATLKASSIHYSGQFQNGYVAMMNQGSWYISTQISKVAKGEADASKNWGIVKYPHAEGVQPGTTLGTITGVAISQGSKQKDAAWKFVKFISSSDCAKVIAATGAFPSILNDDVLAEIASMKGFPTDAASKEALRVYKSYLEMPLSNKSGQIETVLNQCHDEIMTYNISIDAGLAKMSEQVQKILNEK